MNITSNTVVQMHYKLTNQDGMLLDSSEGREPLTYMHGKQMLIPGLENQLEGKAIGEKFTANVVAAEAYGDKSPEMIHVVPKENFSGDGELAAGLQIQIDTNQGTQMAIITKVEGEDVTIDMNHPFAGKTLYFSGEVLNVREAHENEKQHGHVHAGGDHSHH